MAIYKFEDLIKKSGVKPSEVKTVGIPDTTTPKNSGNFASGFGKGVLSTAKGFGQLGESILNNTIGRVNPMFKSNTYNEEALQADKEKGGVMGKLLNEENLKAQNNQEKVGKTVEFIAELLFPAGKVSNLPNIASKTEKVVGANLDNLGSRISTIGDDVMEEGVKVKDKISDLIFKLDDKTKTALQRTSPEDFAKVKEQGLRAIKDDRIRTPLEGVGDDIIDGLKQLQDRASSIGEQKAQYLNQAKIGLKRVGNITRDAMLETKKVFNNMKLDIGDKKVVQTFFNELKKLPSNPTLKEIDATIDLLQDGLYKASRSNAVEVTDRVTGQLRKILGTLNNASQKIGGTAYQQFNKKYSDLIEVVTELNARVGKEGGGAGSFVKRLFSPSDARTKYLFEQLQKFTGKDYFRDARLAKFVMEALGDTRAVNILEQIPTSARGAFDKVIDYGVRKLSDPIKSAERFIKKK